MYEQFEPPKPLKVPGTFQFNLRAMLLLITGVAMLLGAARYDFIFEFIPIIPAAGLLGFLVILAGRSRPKS